MGNIFRTLFNVATGADVGKLTDTLASLNDGKRIRSISSMASRSIFYFPMFVSDDHTVDEINMMQRAAESNYAIMVAECFAQVPAMEVRPNDMNQISSFLDRFHQNLGTDTIGSGEALRKFTSAVSYAQGNMTKLHGMFESVIASQWEAYKDIDNAPAKHLPENYKSLYETYNLPALDNVSEAAYKRELEKRKEIETWGFLGESVPTDMFGFDMASDEEPLPDTDPVTDVEAEDGSVETIPVDEATTKEAYSVMAKKLEEIPDNKIRSATSVAALGKMETKLKGFKKKYTKYLIRYKKKYEGEDKDDGKKLTIRFEGMTIDDPKSFMKVYGEFMKVVNRKLKLCEKRRAQLNKARGKAVVETGHTPAWYSAEIEKCSLDKLDEMSLELLETMDKSIDKMVESADSEIFGYAIDEAPNRYANVNTDEDDELFDAVASRNERQRKKDLNARADEIFAEDQKRAQQAEQDKLRRTYADPSDVRAMRNRMNRADAEAMKNRIKNTPAPGTTRRSTVSGTRNGRISNFSPIQSGKMFTDADIKKANDSLPTIIMVSVKMAVKGTGDVVDYQFPVGIKVHIHRVPVNEMIANIEGSLMQGRKLLSFIKLTSGEEGTISDLLFGISKLKKEAEHRTHGSSAQIYRSALQRRKRVAKMSLPFITKNYTMNGSMLISQNIADRIKEQVGIDITQPNNLRKIMSEEYLFSIYISDSANESVKMFYDNDIAYNEVSYKMLERQAKQSDQQLKELLRILGTNR